MATKAKLAHPGIREQVSAEEWRVRVDLAAAYRLVALNGWDDLIFTHLSARVPGPDNHFLINPFGLMFEEVTASNLVKVDMDGEIVLDSGYPVNPAGFTIHSAIHNARDDAHCVMHTHTVAGVAVSAQREGLLRSNQIALGIYNDVAYHDYEGLALVEEEKARLLADMGTRGSLILRNHGLLTVGHDVAGAWLRLYFLERACQVQIAAQAGGDLLLLDQSFADRVAEQTMSAFATAAAMSWKP
ncbi:MAG: class II aldolase/adducin family protein, partial [Alphaproteobacteria bacterium]